MPRHNWLFGDISNACLNRTIIGFSKIGPGLILITIAALPENGISAKNLPSQILVHKPLAEKAVLDFKTRPFWLISQIVVSDPVKAMDNSFLLPLKYPFLP